MKHVVKRFGGTILLVASLFMLSSILSCGKTAGGKGGTGGGGGNTTSDPALTLDSLKFGTTDITKEPRKLEVEGSVTTVTPANFTAMFKIGKKTTAEKIDISKVELPNGELEAGKATVVTLKIDAVKGKHGNWTGTVEITRKKIQPGQEPEPVLTYLRVMTTEVDIKKKPYEAKTLWNFDTMENNNVRARFKLGSIERELPVQVNDGKTKVKLEINKETEVNLTVVAKTGAYKAWTNKIKITRQAQAAQPAAGHTLRWHNMGYKGNLLAQYAEQDDEDREENLPGVFDVDNGTYTPTKVLKGKWVYLKLTPGKDHKYNGFTIRKETPSSAMVGDEVPHEKSDATGFPKGIKDKGFQVRFRMPDFNVKVFPSTYKEEKGHKVKWDAHPNKGNLTVQYLKFKHDPFNGDGWQPVVSGQSGVEKGFWVYISWEKGPLGKGELKELKIKSKCKPDLKLETNIPDTLKTILGGNFKGCFEMPDCDVEIEAILK